MSRKPWCRMEIFQDENGDVQTEFISDPEGMAEIRKQYSQHSPESFEGDALIQFAALTLKLLWEELYRQRQRHPSDE